MILLTASTNRYYRAAPLAGGGLWPAQLRPSYPASAMEI